MKIETFNGSVENRILVGMVTNSSILGRIAADWQWKPFSCEWANTVGSWCVEHYRKHSSAPGNGIQSHFETWAAQNPSEDRIHLVEKFLHHLSDTCERNGEMNVEATVDEAAEHFNWVRIERLEESLRSAREARDLKKAKDIHANFSLLEIGAGMGEDIFGSREFVQSMFSQEEQKPLVIYPGDLGRFFRNTLSRESFVAFLGPEKSGKTFFLLDVAYRAILQRRRVAFFEVGDMSLRQITKRFYSRLSRKPFHPCTVQWPVSISPPRHGEFIAGVVHEEREFTKGIDADTTWKSCQELMKKKIKSDKQYLKIACYPNSTVNVDGIKADLQRWSLRGWEAEVVIIDYADILAPPPGIREVRDQINRTWQQLRALSLERHCLVVTATQSDAEGYDRKILDRRNFSEDKRKLAHVSGLVGINTTSEEKEKGLTRLNWIVLREGEYSPRRCVHVAGCLATANPALLSVF